MRFLSLALLGIASALPAATTFADEKPSDKTLGAKPPGGAKVLLGDSIDAWAKLDGETTAEWPVVAGVATVGKGSIRSKEKFGSAQIHVEFNVPYMPVLSGM